MFFLKNRAVSCEPPSRLQPIKRLRNCPLRSYSFSRYWLCLDSSFFVKVAGCGLTLELSGGELHQAMARCLPPSQHSNILAGLSSPWQRKLLNRFASSVTV